jgi:signal transduction histidine kinase
VTRLPVRGAAPDEVRRASLQILHPDRRLAMWAEPEPVIVNADEARVRQVIANLLTGHDRQLDLDGR